MPDISLNAIKSAVLTHPLVHQKPVVLTQKDDKQGSKQENREREYGGDNEARQKINKKQAHFQTITCSWEVFHINLDLPFLLISYLQLSS